MTNVPLNIDFSQILLHLFNFIILAGGLYFLLYKPTKSFMDKRETYYKDIDNKAKKTLADCESEKQKYKNLISEAQSQADAIKANALKEADVMAKEHIKSAEDAKAKIISDAKKSAEIESFSDGETLEFPQYTRPEEFKGLRVPDVLLSGHHGKIAEWRAEQSRILTNKNTP